MRTFSEALGAYLTDQLSGLSEKPVVTYGIPGVAAGKNAVSLYLSTMTEDVALRSYERNYERVAGAWVSSPLPLRLKCGYVVTAWPDSQNPSEADLVRQDLLSAAYGVLVGMSTVPSAYLPAPLKQEDLQKPVVALAEYKAIKDPQYWASFGCVFQPAFFLHATVSLPVAQQSYDHVVDGLDITYKNGLVI